MRKIFIVPTLIALTACSSPNENEIVRQVGVLEVVELASVSQAQLTAYFFEMEDGGPAATVRAGFLTYTDSCIIEDIDESDQSGPGDVTAYGVTGSPISAGEVLTVSSSAGSVTELTNPGSSVHFYQANPRPAYPLPAGLTLDIPGDDFAALTAMAIPDASALVIEVPAADESVTVDTEFSWTAAEDLDSRIIFFASVPSEVPESPAQELNCVIVDDGEFEFPEIIKTQLGDEYTFNSIEMYRDARTIVQTEEVMLLMSHSLN